MINCRDDLHNLHADAIYLVYIFAWPYMVDQFTIEMRNVSSLSTSTVEEQVCNGIPTAKVRQIDELKQPVIMFLQRQHRECA